MTDNVEAEKYRRDIARYRYLRANLRDPAMRAYLDRLIQDAEERLAKIAPD